MNSEQLILETLKRLEEKMDAGFKAVDERFKQVDERFKQVDERFKRVDSELGVINEKLDKLQFQADIIAKQTPTHERKFTGISKILAEQ